MGLQQLEVIPFEIRTLRKGHTEQRRTRRFYIATIVRHRGTVGAWRNRGYLRVLLMFWSTSLQSICFARFLKTFITKVISNTYTTALSLFVPSAPPWDCLCIHLRVLPLSVCLLYVVGLLYHSIFWKNLKYTVEAYAFISLCLHSPKLIQRLY